MSDERERARQEMARHRYSFQELEDAARELAAMRIATNADWVRHVYSLDDEELAAEFDSLIQQQLMTAPRMGREPDTHRMTPMFALALLIQAVWDYEETLLRGEPDDDPA
jgi:hypothetical protein